MESRPGAIEGSREWASGAGVMRYTRGSRPCQTWRVGIATQTQLDRRAGPTRAQIRTGLDRVPTGSKIVTGLGPNGRPVPFRHLYYSRSDRRLDLEKRSDRLYSLYYKIGVVGSKGQLADLARLMCQPG